MKTRSILLTNDDGIASPGLWAAAQALSSLGYVHVVAPKEQFSGAGRSLPAGSDGSISLRQVRVNGQDWPVYAVGGSPAQVVQHAMIEILASPPDLVVAGINSGENVGSGITISGTIGAALEAAALGFPALAVSLETSSQYHYNHSPEVDFSAAAHFTQFFAQRILEKSLPFDVDVLKVDVPASASAQTPWKVTRLSRMGYFLPAPQPGKKPDLPLPMSYRPNPHAPEDEPGTDIYALCVERLVSVTPLSLDQTSRVSLQQLEAALRGAA